jgi:hypothetical protein
MQMRLGAPFPTRVGGQSSTSPGLPCIPPARLDIARVGHAAGLASLPNCVVALTAVPGVGARPFSTTPSLPGAQPTGCGSIPPAKAAHKERQLEINTAGRMCDRRNWDIAVKYGRYVPPSLILDVCVAVGGGNGTTAGCMAPAATVSPRTGVPPSRGRPPERQRNSVVIPTRPPPHVRERRERDRHTRFLGLCATRKWRVVFRSYYVDRSEVTAEALARALTVFSERSMSHDPSEMSQRALARARVERVALISRTGT